MRRDALSTSLFVHSYGTLICIYSAVLLAAVASVLPCLRYTSKGELFVVRIARPFYETLTFCCNLILHHRGMNMLA